MKGRFIALIVAILIATVAFTSSPVSPATQAAGPDCGVIRSVCNDVWWGGMYPLCMETIGEWATCQTQSHAGYGGCVIDAGCPLHD